MVKKKILIGSPIRQKPKILKEFLNSLEKLNTESLDVQYLFIDDNDILDSSELLKEYAEKYSNCSVYKNEDKSLEYITNENTHHWNEVLIWKVAKLKNMIIQIALDFNFDFLFFLDSDLVLHPDTLNKLLESKKDIISNIFWTKWEQHFPELPQVWLRDTYDLYTKYRNENLSSEEVSRRQLEFISSLNAPGIYEVGGLGACTLISRRALKTGCNFSEIKNLSFWGEDRHFCIRAVALGFSLFVDTHYPAFHIYRESDLERLENFKKNFSFQ